MRTVHVDAGLSANSPTVEVRTTVVALRAAVDEPLVCDRLRAAVAATAGEGTPRAAAGVSR